MARYIDADVLWKRTTTKFDDCEEFLDLIETQPTADVVERKRGDWIEDDDATVKGHCSVCGWESHYCEDDVLGMPFCPNCGARMEE